VERKEGKETGRIQEGKLNDEGADEEGAGECPICMEEIKASEAVGRCSGEHGIGTLLCHPNINLTERETKKREETILPLGTSLIPSNPH
jgi:hypothetical protein